MQGFDLMLKMAGIDKTAMENAVRQAQSLMDSFAEMRADVAAIKASLAKLDPTFVDPAVKNTIEAVPISDVSEIVPGPNAADSFGAA